MQLPPHESKGQDIVIAGGRRKGEGGWCGLNEYISQGGGLDWLPGKTYVRVGISLNANGCGQNVVVPVRGVEVFVHVTRKFLGGACVGVPSLDRGNVENGECGQLHLGRYMKGEE